MPQKSVECCEFDKQPPLPLHLLLLLLQHIVSCSLIRFTLSNPSLTMFNLFKGLKHVFSDTHEPPDGDPEPAIPDGTFNVAQSQGTIEEVNLQPEITKKPPTEKKKTIGKMASVGKESLSNRLGQVSPEKAVR